MEIDFVTFVVSIPRALVSVVVGAGIFLAIMAVAMIADWYGHH